MMAISMKATRCSFVRSTMVFAAGDLPQDRDDALGVVHVGRRGVDRQRNAVLLDGNMDLYTADLFAAVHATREAARGRRAGAAVDHHRARLGPIAAGQPPRAA